MQKNKTISQKNPPTLRINHILKTGNPLDQKFHTKLSDILIFCLPQVSLGEARFPWPSTTIFFAFSRF